MVKTFSLSLRDSVPDVEWGVVMKVVLLEVEVVVKHQQGV